ncbi:MAG: sodium:solute symporter family protein, partial [Bacteroidota bacterium]
IDTITRNQIALAIFLLLNLWVAFKAIVKKPRTMREYALANQSLGISTLMMTLFATLMSSNLIGLNVAYANGIIGFIYPFCFAFMAMLLGWFIFPNLVNFTQCYTMADVMYKIYGPFARLCTVLVSSLFTLVVVVIQLQAVGHMGSLVGIKPFWLILMVGLFITLYTSLGGVRAVAFTDVIQFAAFWGGILFVAYTVVIHYGGLQAIWENIPDDNNNIKKRFFCYPNFGQRFFSAFFWAIWPTILISPAVIQRVLMTRNKQQVRHMFVAFGSSYMCLRILTFFIGCCLFFAPKGSLPKSLSLNQIIDQLSLNPMVKMAFLITFLGIVISTVDSLLNTLSVMWAHNLIKPYQKRKQNEENTIKMSSKITLILGCCITLIACYNTRKMFDLVEYSYIIISCITIPFILGVKGLKGNDTIFQLTIGSFCAIFFFMFFYLKESALLKNLIELLCDNYNTTRSPLLHNPLHIKFSWFFAIIGSSIALFPF